MQQLQNKRTPCKKLQSKSRTPHKRCRLRSEFQLRGGGGGGRCVLFEQHLFSWC